MLITVEINDKMRKWAKEQAFDAEGNKHNEPEVNTHGSPLIGKLGEASFWKHFPASKYCNKPDHDFLTPDGQLVDCKAWMSPHIPLPHYWCQALDSSRERYVRPTFFFFMCVNDKHTVAWLCGYIETEKFYKIGEHRKKGYVRHNPQRFEALGDTTEVTVTQLYEPGSLIFEHPTCNSCTFYRFKGLEKWCRLIDEPIGERWGRGCPRYDGMYAKVLPK